MAKSNYLEQKVLDHVLNKVAYTSPTTYVALFTTAVGDDASGTEVSGGSYAREIVYENAGGTPDWNLATVDGVGYLVDNNDAIDFTQATADWGTVSHVGIFDAVSGGNLLYHGALTASQAVNNGSVFSFAAGDLNIREE